MARDRRPARKLARNAGGTLDGFPKTESLRRAYPSGQHGQARKKHSEYALQLKEKQKVRITYGLLEKQFRSYYEHSVRKTGVTGTLLLQRLESRLDNIVYRSTLGITRRQARQFIVHSHFLVNGKKVNIPSYLMKPGDVITVRERSQKFVKSTLEERSYFPSVPMWIESDQKELTAKVVSVPERTDIDSSINEQLIIEYYSR